MRITPMLLLAAALVPACADPSGLPGPPLDPEAAPRAREPFRMSSDPAPATAALPTVHVVTESADGTFSPMWTYAHDGDYVLWQLRDRTGAVVPVTWSGNWPAPCSTPKPWNPADANNFAGPNLPGSAGVWALSPVGAGLVSQATSCPVDTEVDHETDYLCRTGADGETMASTWSDPAIDGVFLRLLWNQLEPADCSSADLTTCWDWSVVDREIAAAVANGKLYSISVKAGDDGTPDWIFSTDADDTVRPYANPGVIRLHLQDSGNDTLGCGARMDLGDPTQAEYQAEYFDMLTALAAHIKTRADWYRALAAVKPSGANLQSHENRLPKRCDTSAGCVCNTEVLAQRGYTPAGLYAFYTAQFDLLADLFPGKAQSYALIQQGFPRITSSTIYQIDDDIFGNVRSSNGNPADLPLPAEQTEEILAIGAATAAAEGFVWNVSHNGLGPTLAPNQWVLDAAAADATTLTGFQTNNAAKVPDAPALDETFVNLENNAPEATYLEIYEERGWEAAQIGGVLSPAPAGTGRTLADWGQLLRDRRNSVFPSLRDPDSINYLTRVHYTIPSGNQIIHYVDPAKCSGPGFRYGALSIQP